MDVGALIRVRNAARESIAATPADHGSAWQGLVETYQALLQQARELMDEVSRSEMDRLFAKEIDTDGAGRSPVRDPSAMFKQQEVASEARTRIAALAGWLDGHIEEAQLGARLEAEANAYARERVRRETSSET